MNMSSLARGSQGEQKILLGWSGPVLRSLQNEIGLL